LKEAEESLLRTNGDAIVAQLRNGPFEVAGVPLGTGDLTVDYQAADGWAGVSDRGTEVTVDTRITPELKAEGLARDVIRLVQDERKKAGLDVADKIALYLGTESDALTQAIAAHRATIAAETQAVEWLDTSPAGGHTASVKVDGQPLTIALRKV
jgi:isoleucyl-tRNA synthetase